jgi:hypothetical protein
LWSDALNEDFFVYRIIASVTKSHPFTDARKDEKFTISKFFYNPAFIMIGHYNSAFDFESGLFHYCSK